MSRGRYVGVAAGAALAIGLAVAVSGAGAAAAEAMKPLLVRDINQPFTILLQNANAGTTDPLHCQDVPLPGGDLVIQNVNAGFTGPVDAYLRIPASVMVTPPQGEPQLGQTATYVRLEAVRQNLASNAGKALRFEGMLRIAAAFPTAPDLLFRDSDDPVQLCAEDDVIGVGQGGPVVISGHILR